MPRRALVVGLVGTGLMGGSIGLAFRRAGCLVLGFDRDETAARRALHLGLIDQVAHSLAGLGKADLVFVAVPPAVAVETVEALLDEGIAAVTDVTSVKGFVARALAARPNFVGGHPMTGRDQSGPDAARDDLFLGAIWVLTPGPDTDPGVRDLVDRAVRTLAASPVFLDPDEHDRLVAYISHLPHLVAAALVEVASADRATAVAGSGFRDLTRIARGDSSLWVDIVSHNRGAVVRALDSLMRVLERFRDEVADGNWLALEQSLAAAAQARAALDDRQEEPFAARPAG